MTEHWGSPALESAESGSEADKDIKIVAELPSMDERDVDVCLAEGVLTIRGERKSEQKKREKDHILQEPTFGTIEWVIPLPEVLDLESVKAVFRTACSLSRSRRWTKRRRRSNASRCDEGDRWPREVAKLAPISSILPASTKDSLSQRHFYFVNNSHCGDYPCLSEN